MDWYTGNGGHHHQGDWRARHHRGSAGMVVKSESVLVWLL